MPRWSASRVRRADARRSAFHRRRPGARHAPTGGFRGDRGVQDGYDLAWKLTYVLDGQGSETLLATYDAERQPVRAFTTEQAYTRRAPPRPLLGQEDLMPIVGRRRSNWLPSPLLRRRRGADDDGALGRTRASRPGPGLSRPARADHGRRRRTVGLGSFGAVSVLLAGSAARAGLPRHVRRAPRSACPWTCTDRNGRGRPERHARGRVRHRPGGRRAAPAGRLVVWRATAASSDPEGDLSGALRAALCRGAVVAART